MESINRRKIIILMLCLLIVAYAISGRIIDTQDKRSTSLENSVVPLLHTWHVHKKVLLGDNIVEALKLDDYVNSYLSNGKDIIALYIGYYLTKKKVGAAHSPLVCFPGQGWYLYNFADLEILIGAYKVNLESMVIEKGDQKHLVLYWYQAYDQTSPGTFMQKVNLFKTRLISAREDNAFVRIMIPFGSNRTKEEAQIVGVGFIEKFYPVFHQYITD